MDFALTADHVRIQTICRELAADFASRAAAHDLDASSPLLDSMDGGRKAQASPDQVSVRQPNR